ncbi:polysaccharide pyruvyl transferase family protein [Solibacillus isronensis]|uniref:polysaccharide pyruvyl transferase family protein n=1 Tax=Solibacillus isronensis TaxID=412383 RepID=UPI0009A6DCD7|nr:polysaccharide pyruvyl transferase family protein [Solibacillus isronensis]
MKKIGILTINDYNNYGNRLQNYASQEVLKSFGYSVETIVNTSNIKENEKNKLSKAVSKISIIKNKSFNEFFMHLNKSVNLKIKSTFYKRIYLGRLKAFKGFTKSYIKETDFKIFEDNVPVDLANEYDYFITGSDQVWNPNFRKGSSIDFLTFAPKEKRIAYAPSFGISEIPADYVRNYKIWLSEMEHVSVREVAGAKIIKDLTGRDAAVLVDPTLMLTEEKWLSVSKIPTNKPKKYLLTYFLGGISKDKKKIILEIAKKNDLEIVNLGQLSNQVAYQAGPGEFINYINSANVFLTDSFHGCVFSILFNTPFIVFDRDGKLPSMNSRIDTLLSTFKLESRLAKNIKTNEQIFEVDYSHVGPILEAERNKAMNYLKTALSVDEF